MKKDKPERLDPRLEGFLINLPNSWYGRRLIAHGPDEVWAHAVELIAQYDRNSLMWLLKRSLVQYFDGREDVGVKMQPGEYPGADQTLHITINHPLRLMVAIIGWDENDNSWLFSQLYVEEDDGGTGYVADVIRPQLFNLDHASTLWDVEKIALYVHDRLMELEVL